MPRKANTSGDHYYDPFPTRLRGLMRKRKMNQTRLSEVLGFDSRQAVTKYIDGTSTYPADKTKRLAIEFGVSADYLLGLTDIETPNVDLQEICKYTGLDERTVERLHGYTTLHKDCAFFRKALNSVLYDTELYAVLHALKRAIEVEKIWEDAGKPIICCEEPYERCKDKSGNVIISAGAARVFYEDYAKRELSLIVHSLIRRLTSDEEELEGWDEDGDSDTEG